MRGVLVLQLCPAVRGSVGRSLRHTRVSGAARVPCAASAWDWGTVEGAAVSRGPSPAWAGRMGWLLPQFLSRVHVSLWLQRLFSACFRLHRSSFPHDLWRVGIWECPLPLRGIRVLQSAALFPAVDKLHVFSSLENNFFRYNLHLKCHWLFFPPLLSRLTALPWKPLLEEKTFLLVTPETVWCFWKQSSAPAGYFHFHQHEHRHTSF